MPWDINLSNIVLDGELSAFTGALDNGSGLDPAIDRKRWVAARRRWLMAWMLIQTGIRLAELLDLRVCDMPGDLGIDFIEVHKGKGKKSRNVPVSAEFAAVIEDYIRDVRPFTVPQRMAKTSRKGKLFYNDRKKRVNDRTFQRFIHRVAADTGIKKPITPHKFRHRFCCNALKSDGTNIFLVKNMMGHASITTTEKYLHVTDQLDGRVGESLNQMPKEVMEDYKRNAAEYRGVRQSG